jgi:UDP-N-acetylmuramoyl-L-alanyl-D-glutamate--2,6-diaminopimelate ligase
MLLSELIQSTTPLATGGSLATEVRELHYDSRLVKPGALFFALRGVASDGHRFIGAALFAGAAAVVLEDESFAPEGSTWIKVADARRAMALMASSFYGKPTAAVPLVGITGTNGKTTTTYLVEGILAAAGRSAAVLGTVNYRYLERVIPAPHTTPESVDLQCILRELVDLGARGVVMEVSSHALEQHRVDGCRFDVGVFTNLTRDHLDYHHDMESYLASKQRLFSELLVPDRVKPQRRAVINLDDAYGAQVKAASACPVIGYGLDPAAQVTARDIRFTVDGISGVLVTPLGEILFRSRLLGRFNLYNILAAVGAGVALDLPLTAIRDGIECHARVPGRLERVDNGRGVTLLVDYAHTGDALENVLRTVKELAEGRIITVFGCGGDRDKGKRPIMGEIAGRYSDLAIITSDNPRTEDPSFILSQVRDGILPLGLQEYSQVELAGEIREKGFCTVENRREAIRLAVKLARLGDIILLAGKGHEDYQIIGTEKHHFDDREEAARAFAEMGN